jgi:TonB family protein
MRPLGYGLDELAVEAVKKWTFKPGKSSGKPVPAKITIEVPFRYH